MKQMYYLSSCIRIYIYGEKLYLQLAGQTCYVFIIQQCVFWLASHPSIDSHSMIKLLLQKLPKSRLIVTVISIL